MHPFIDTPLARLKEASHHFLKRVDLEINENKAQFFFHCSQARCTPTPIAALASLLGDMAVIHIRMVRNGKGCQQCFKLRLLQTCEGTERAGVMLESLIGEHGGHLQPGMLDFAECACSLLYHCFG